MLSRREVEQAIRSLLGKYHADYAILFGSYARNAANANSDIDVVLVGGANFRARDVFAFGEELRELTANLTSTERSCGKGCGLHNPPEFVQAVQKIITESNKKAALPPSQRTTPLPLTRRLFPSLFSCPQISP